MKKFLVLVIIVTILVLGFYALNSYIYNEKQGSEPVVFIDGEHFGFIRAFTDNNTAFDFDSAIWLSGKDGKDAAIAAGVCTEETRTDCLNNDYFIENTSIKSVRVVVSPDVQVFMQTLKMEETGEVTEREISLENFAELVNDEALYWNSLPYKITILDNSVIKITEVYVP
jgi:hypothetical protein